MTRWFSRVVPAVALATTLLVPQLALAHAVLVDSNPKPNETVHGAALEIDLKFNSRVDGARSTLQLASSDGSAQTLPISTQAAPNEITSHAEGLAKGAYTLRWQALSSDGHLSRGQIPFQVE